MLTHDQIGRLIDNPDARGEVPAVDVAEALLARIEAFQPSINAFVTVTPELALADARRVDSARAAGKPLPLDGLPLAVKDNIDVAGVVTTMASRFFLENVAERDAEVVERLRAAGAVVLGKTSLHEFAFGATTANPPPFGICRNPWDTERTSGGSSGGSGAALAADLCFAALGTDTGGSVRIPAALNGISGLRPTFGSISNRGVFHVAATFDTVGPMARDARDVARLHALMTGFDPADPRAVEHAPPDQEEPGQGVVGLRIGVPRGFFFESVEPEVEACVRAAAAAFADLGATVSEIELAADESLCAAAAVIVRSEALALHRERFNTRPELFGEEIRQRFAIGGELRAWELAASLERMYDWRRSLRGVFEQVDVVMTPGTRIVAPRIEGAESVSTSWDLTYFTYPWSCAGVPVLSIPCGFGAGSLPVGMQLVTRDWQERLLFRAAFAYQEVTDWHRRRAPLALSLR